MKILHTSDLHSKFVDLLHQLQTIPDLNIWIDTGDFFPNMTRGTIAEVGYQTNWALVESKCAQQLAAVCIARNIKVISVSGNHDYVSLAALLQHCGMPANTVFDLSSQNRSVTIDSVKFAGFRQIPFIIGEWAGETEMSEFKAIVDEAMAHDPDILLTHSPAGGILASSNYNINAYFGITYLTSYLMHRGHNVKAHLFGHVHNDGGKTQIISDILFSNAAAKKDGNILVF